MSVILTVNEEREFEPGVDRWFFRRIWAPVGEEFVWRMDFDEDHLDEPWHQKITFHEAIYKWYFPKGVIMSPNYPPPGMSIGHEGTGKWRVPARRESYWLYMLQPDLPNVDWLPCRQHYAPISCSLKEMAAYLKSD